MWMNGVEGEGRVSRAHGEGQKQLEKPGALILHPWMKEKPFIYRELKAEIVARARVN